jgi:hypothetical protein
MVCTVGHAPGRANMELVSGWDPLAFSMDYPQQTLKHTGPPGTRGQNTRKYRWLHIVSAAAAVFAYRFLLGSHIGAVQTLRSIV